MRELTNYEQWQLEEWKDIPGYEGFYQISSYSRLRSLPRIVNRGNHQMKLFGMILAPTQSKDGYYSVKLSKDGVCKTHNIHRLVAEAFIPNPENKIDVNHIDGDKGNNVLSNLEWSTRSENCLHAFANGLSVSKKLSEHNKARPVVQLNLNGTFVKRYDCAIIACNEHGYDNGAISKACNGKLQTAYGFIWVFEDEMDLYEDWKLKKKWSEEIEEPGEREADRSAEWCQFQHERQLHEYDNQYTNTRH